MIAQLEMPGFEKPKSKKSFYGDMRHVVGSDGSRRTYLPDGAEYAFKPVGDAPIKADVNKGATRLCPTCVLTKSIGSFASDNTCLLYTSPSPRDS